MRGVLLVGLLATVALGAWMGGSATTIWLGGLFDLLLLVSLSVFGKEQVPLLQRAIAGALVFTLLSRFFVDQSAVQTLFLAAAGLCWLLALRIPTPLILLRGDPPFPGSIKSMAGIPFLLWPMMVVFFLAPEMPEGWGGIGWQGVIFAGLGAAAASRIGRVGPRSMALAMLAMISWGTGWTILSLVVADPLRAGWAWVGLVAGWSAQAGLVAALLAEDGPRISAEALAAAEAIGPDVETPSDPD